MTTRKIAWGAKRKTEKGLLFCRVKEGGWQRGKKMHLWSGRREEDCSTTSQPFAVLGQDCTFRFYFLESERKMPSRGKVRRIRTSGAQGFWHGSYSKGANPNWPPSCSHLAMRPSDFFLLSFLSHHRRIPQIGKTAAVGSSFETFASAFFMEFVSPNHGWKPKNECLPFLFQVRIIKAFFVRPLTINTTGKFCVG